MRVAIRLDIEGSDNTTREKARGLLASWSAEASAPQVRTAAHPATGCPDCQIDLGTKDPIEAILNLYSLLYENDLKIELQFSPED